MKDIFTVKNVKSVNFHVPISSSRTGLLTKIYQILYFDKNMLQVRIDGGVVY